VTLGNFLGGSVLTGLLLIHCFKVPRRETGLEHGRASDCRP